MSDSPVNCNIEFDLEAWRLPIRRADIRLSTRNSKTGAFKDLPSLRPGLVVRASGIRTSIILVNVKEEQPW